MGSKQDKPETISLYQFSERFPNEEAACKYFDNSTGVMSLFAFTVAAFTPASAKITSQCLIGCCVCRKHFSVRTGSVLVESRLPLHKWLMVIHMMTTARKGIPFTQMARELGITQKSA